jgi:hypothetical protein
VNPDTIAQTVAAVLAPLITLIGLASRHRRLRSAIRENLALLEELQKDEVLREHTPACGWLQGKVALDVAKLAGQPLGTPKKPIPKGSAVLAVILGAGFSFWTYYIVRDGFVWYSVFPGIAAFLMFVSIFGMFTDRDLPPEASGTLPPGAVPMRTETASEQVATAIAVASSGQADDRFNDSGQIGVAYKFLEAMRDGRFEDGLTFVDENWRLCRIQSWLWNNRDQFGSDVTGLQQLATSLLNDRKPVEVWEGFVGTEAHTFVLAWGPLSPDRLGAASRRRRVARDYDIVILAPVDEGGGYFVMAATALPNALTFLMHHTNGHWLVANHLGNAPPQPGWPPAWWALNDPTVEALPDDGD